MYFLIKAVKIYQGLEDKKIYPSQLDFLNKTVFKIKSNSVLKFNSQFSTSSNIPRYDNLQDYDEKYMLVSEIFIIRQIKIVISQCYGNIIY